MNQPNNKPNNLDGIIEKIFKEDELIQFLSENSIADVEQIYSIQTYQKDHDRRGIVVNAQENNKDERSKILIDLKQGQPSINQVFDSLYNIGKDCSIKIIMFTGGINENDIMIPTADEFVVNGLIDQLQESNVGILLCKIWQEKIKIIDHSLYDYWIQVDRTGEIEIPTEEQFLMHTFWSVYFDSNSECFYDPWSAYNHGFRDIKDWGFLIHTHGVMKGEIQLYWDEQGVRYKFVKTDCSAEYLKRMLDVDMPALKQRYGDNSIRYENVIGQFPRLFIQFSDIPISWLNTADPKQITDFAGKLYNDAWELRYQFEASAEKLFEPVHVTN
jgi:hypothetical protein